MRNIISLLLLGVIVSFSSCTKDSPYPYGIEGPYDSIPLSSSDTIYGPSYAIYIPSSFTPDKDGLNDVFGIYSWYISEEDFSCKIYMNQELVFSSADRDFRWDGTYKDDVLPNRHYNYLIHFKSLYDDEIKKLEGQVYLLR